MALTKVSRGLLSTSIVDNGNATAITIDSSEKVGIGTSSPASLLHLENSAGGSGGYTKFTDVTYGGDVRFGMADGVDNNAISGVWSNNDYLIYTNSTERLRIDSSGNVGIGVVPEAWDPAFTEVLQVGLASLITSGGDNARVFSNAYYDGAYKRIGTGYAHSYEQSGGTHRWFIAASGSADSSISWAESMRIDSSGNLLVGVTTNSSSVAGVTAGNSGLITACRSSNYSGIFNRLSTDGDIVQFRKDGSVVGSIGVQASGTLFIAGSSSQNTGVRFFNTGVAPCTSSGAYVDNSKDLGSSSVRWDDVYATNGTIQTSDRNEKQDIAELSEAEQRVAVAAKGLLRKFRWKDSVAEKGDDARIHFGIIAQDLQAAFEAEGLDAGDYAMFISSTWTDEETNEEKTRMGVRYSELLAFIISAI